MLNDNKNVNSRRDLLQEAKYSFEAFKMLVHITFVMTCYL